MEVGVLMLWEQNQKRCLKIQKLLLLQMKIFIFFTILILMIHPKME